LPIAICQLLFANCHLLLLSALCGQAFAVGFANCYLLIAICLFPMMIYLQKSASNL
jgi:hypothetical protein